MARSRSKIKLQPTLFIACEGTSSEYQYFQSWAETDAALTCFSKIDVYPDEREDKPKTTPYQLYEVAKKVLEDGSADFAWIVFDHDGHPRLPETFAGAAASRVNIAFSHRSFEQWVLAHFRKDLTPFQATECKDLYGKPTNCGTQEVQHCDPVDCLTGHIRRQQFITGYSKKKTFDLFTAIQHRTEIAIVNAAWLRFRQHSSVQGPRPAPIQINPYTDVDQLILQINGWPDKVEWGTAGTPVRLMGWTISVTAQGGAITLELSHNSAQPVPLNATFVAESFFTTDHQLN